MRFRRLAIVSALVVGAGLAAPLAASAATTPAPPPPASPVYCSFGDNFYGFSSPGTGDVIDSNNIFPAYGDDEQGEYGDFVCQVKDGMPGFYEWALKGTSYCLTLDKANGYLVDYKTCAGLASQNWALVDYLGNNKYGGLQSNYTNYGYRYMHDNGGGQLVVAPTGWNPNDPYWNWQLGGPYQ